jgi:hypothetical protein
MNAAAAPRCAASMRGSARSADGACSRWLALPSPLSAGPRARPYTRSRLEGILHITGRQSQRMCRRDERLFPMPIVTGEGRIFASLRHFPFGCHSRLRRPPRRCPRIRRTMPGSSLAAITNRHLHHYRRHSAPSSPSRRSRRPLSRLRPLHRLRSLLIGSPLVNEQGALTQAL